MGACTYNFTGRVVVITGANGNLGSAVARAFAKTKAQLVLVGRNPDRVRAALPYLVQEEGVLVAPPTDLTDAQAVDTMILKTLERFDRIDVLANTVGAYEGDAPIQDNPIDVWERMMAINARTAYIISRGVIPAMVEQAYGKIIHTAARAALTGSRRASSYSASKAAVVRLTETLAEALKGKGINVNCVLPGTIDTPENRQAMPKADHDRWVPASHIADVFLYLASDGASAIHGAAIPAYGLS